MGITNEKVKSFNTNVLKIGFIFLASFAALILLFSWIVGQQWTNRSYEEESISRYGVIGDLHGGDVIQQRFDSNCEVIHAITIEPKSINNQISGDVLMQILSDEKVLVEKTIHIDLPSNDKYMIAFPEGELVGIKGEELTLSLTMLNNGQGALPSFWYGNSINVGKFEVAVTDLERLTLNDQRIPGKLCMSITGTNYSGIMQYYWPIMLILLLAGIVYVFVLAYKKQHNIRSIILLIGELINKYSFLLEQLVTRDFNTKYRQSVLGVVWSLLNPLLTMGVQYFVFSTIFSNDIKNFPVYLITGIIMFNFFSESVTLGLESIVTNASLIRKVYMPKYIYPISRTLSSLINLLISFIPLILLMLVMQVQLTKALLLLPLAVIFLFAFSLGMSFLLATGNVFFRDTKFLWNVVSLLWNFLTPIFYPESIIPPPFQAIYHVNPMYQFIRFFRCITLEGVTPQPVDFLFCFLCSIIPLLIGLIVFRKSQDKFVLYL